MNDETSYFVFVLLLIFAVLAFFSGFFFIKRITNTEDDNIKKVTTEEVNIIQQITEGTTIEEVKTTIVSKLTDEERVNYNNMLSKYNELFSYVFEVDENANPLKDINYNDNLLKNEKFKLSYTVFSLYLEGSATLDSESNALIINNEIFNNKYTSMFDETFDISKIEEDDDSFNIESVSSDGTNLIATVNLNILSSSLFFKSFNVDGASISSYMIYTNEEEKKITYIDPSFNDIDISDIFSVVEFTIENDKITKLVFREF